MYKESRIQHPDLDFDDLPITDLALVDGTIYEVCNEFERAMGAIQGARAILSPIAYRIVTKNADEYLKAIQDYRHTLISPRGKERLGIHELG